MTMTKRKGQTSDWKTPKARAQRSRKRKAEESEDPLTEPNNDEPAVRETKKQDTDNINSNSQNASVSLTAPEEHPGICLEPTDSSSTAECKELGDAVALSGEKPVPSGLEQGDTVTSEEQEPNQPAPSESLDAQSDSTKHTKENQLFHTTTLDEDASDHQTESSVQTSSFRATDASVDGQATGGGAFPTLGDEMLEDQVEMEVEAKDHHHHPQELREEGEEAAHLPREEKPELGCEASSQGTDGGDPADPPARKKVRKRMGMGRLRGERKNLLEEQNYSSVRKNGVKDGGDEKDGVIGGEEGLKVNDGPSLSEKQGTVQSLVVAAQLESITALIHSSDETERSGQSQTGQSSRIVPNGSEMVTREDQTSTGPRKLVSSREHGDVSPVEEVDLKESKGLQKSSVEDGSGGATFSHSPSHNMSVLTMKPSGPSSLDVGEAGTAGIPIQKPAVTAATAAKHNIPDIPDDLLKEEGAHHSNSDDDVLKSTEGTGALGCDDPVMSRSCSTAKPSEPTAPSGGEESNVHEAPVQAKGHTSEALTDITPDLTPDPSFTNTVTDSQLNDITLIMELEDQHVPESFGAHEDATELVCGLIRELSALNRTIMAAHRELESVRRGNRTAKTPQRQPLTPHNPET